MGFSVSVVAGVSLLDDEIETSQVVSQHERLTFRQVHEGRVNGDFLRRHIQSEPEGDLERLYENVSAVRIA